MLNFLRYSLILGCTALLWACNTSNGDPDNPGPGTDDPEEIRFSSRDENFTSQAYTYALEDFPNNRRIGVIAAYHTTGTINWTAYPDIDDAPATASAYDTGTDTFDFTWDDTKYWPFDNSALSFLAYSPVASESTAIELSFDRKSLSITLQPDMPDVLYASTNENAPTTPYSKNPKPTRVVNLGTFKHALSQLTLEIVADPSMNPAVRLDSLTVTTTKKNAVLDLLGGDTGLTLGTDETFTYNLVTSSTNFRTTTVKPTVLLFPWTEDVTEIALKLSDGTFAVRNTYTLSDIEYATNSTLTLDRAVNTIVRITVKGTTVQNPDENIELLGTVTDWNFQGSFGVTIK